MSRTYVHAPHWVKERDPKWRDFYQEDHNHSWYVTGHEEVMAEDGRLYWKSIWARVERCDLDTHFATRGSARTACSIRLSARGRNIHCGCLMCTGKRGRRADRRGERHLVRKILRSGRWEDGIPRTRRRYFC